MSRPTFLGVGISCCLAVDKFLGAALHGNANIVMCQHQWGKNKGKNDKAGNGSNGDGNVDVIPDPNDTPPHLKNSCSF